MQFKEFQTWEGTTDENGHAKFEIKLPDYFVGQPLQKGNALVRLEVKVTDTADHTETINRTYPVSDQAIQVSLIPEGGRLVPGMENRVFAAAIYPDGSPAVCDVSLWLGGAAAARGGVNPAARKPGPGRAVPLPPAPQPGAGVPKQGLGTEDNEKARKDKPFATLEDQSGRAGGVQAHSYGRPAPSGSVGTA